MSGKCISRSEELVYDYPNWAFPYFVVITDNCLDHKAQFLYLNNTELLHNIEKGGTLMSATGSYRSRWAVYKGVNRKALAFQKSQTFYLKQTTHGSLIQDNICAEPEIRYVKRRSYCNKTSQHFTFGK